MRKISFDVIAKCQADIEDDAPFTDQDIINEQIAAIKDAGYYRDWVDATVTEASLLKPKSNTEKTTAHCPTGTTVQLLQGCKVVQEYDNLNCKYCVNVYLPTGYILARIEGHLSEWLGRDVVLDKDADIVALL